MSIETMKLALEALEWFTAAEQGDEPPINQAITALRQAIEQAQEPVAVVAEVHMNRYTIEWTNGPLPESTQLYTSPPQQKQEPVACGGEQEAPYIGHDCAPYMTDSMKVFCPACCTKFRAIPSDVQKLLLDAGFEPPFDTSAPQRQPWIGLTDKDKQIAFDDTQEGGGFWEFADAIEATLKRKNHG
jgi:hypothetical protein